MRNDGGDSGLDIDVTTGPFIVLDLATGVAILQDHIPDLMVDPSYRTTKLVLKGVEPGSFMMGSGEGPPENGPVREVEIVSGYHLGVFEVTQGQWAMVAGVWPSHFSGPMRPVDRVNWHDAVAFAQALSTLSGLGFRLPTEAEWEYAARAGTASHFSHGPLPCLAHMLYAANSVETADAGSLRPNPWGFFDMHGNVAEWCADWFSADYYSLETAVDPQGPDSGSSKVLRGGAWSMSAAACRSAARGRYLPRTRRNDFGLRVALSSSAGDQFATLTVAIEPEGGGEVSPSAGSHVVPTGVALPLTASPAPGYAFMMWAAEGGAILSSPDDAETFVTLTGSATVTATFAVLAHTVWFMTDGTDDAGIAGDLEQSVPDAGTTSQVTAIAPAGFEFSHWTLGAPGDVAYSYDNPVQVGPVTANMTLVANFEEVRPVIYVNHAATGANDGSSWGNAFTDLQTALGAASAGDAIWVAAGTYLPTQDSDRTVSFMMAEDVHMYGGFAGIEVLRNQRDWTANESILSGDIGVPGDVSDNSFTVIMGADAARLDGFTITGGNADGESPHNRGGGMINEDVVLTIANCKFAHNSSMFRGAGMHCQNSDVTVISCVFFQNSAIDEFGGGLVSFAGTMALNNCAFVENSAFEGGGLCSFASSLSIVNSTFDGNSAGPRGGGLLINSGAALVLDCTFTGNSASFGGGASTDGDHAFIDCIFRMNSASEGGGMFIFGSNPIIEGCIFEENTASSFGGGLLAAGYGTITDCLFIGNTAATGGGLMSDGGNTLIQRCVFRGNTAITNGGGLFTWAGSPMIVGCEFSENTAAEGGGMNNDYNDPIVINSLFVRNTANTGGGGMANTHAEPFVLNCTFSGNSADYGGGIYNLSSLPQIVNCILWGNITTNEGVIFSDDAEPLVIYSNIEGGLAGEGNIDQDPLFVDAAEDDFRLQASSPCIDAGTDAPFETGGVAEVIVSDFEGGLRMIGSSVDMGAYEYQGH